jgi:hypothetical protein
MRGSQRRRMERLARLKASRQPINMPVPVPAPVALPEAEIDIRSVSIITGICHRWHKLRPDRDPERNDLCAACGAKLNELHSGA